MNDSPAESALATIRALELEQAQRIENERIESEAAVDGARTEAEQVVREARERGLARAELTHQQKVAAARSRADQIRAEGHAKAERMLRIARPRLAGLVDEMLEIVLATQPNEDRP